MEIFTRPEEVFELNRFFVIVSLIIFFTALFLWPLGWFFRQPGMNKDGKKTPSYRPMFTIGRYLSIIQIGIALVVYFYLRKHVELIDVVSFPGISADAGFLSNLMLGLPSILSILIPLQFLALVLIWIGKHGTKIFRIQFSLVSVFILVFLLFLISWNLVMPGYYFGELF